MAFGPGLLGLFLFSVYHKIIYKFKLCISKTIATIRVNVPSVEFSNRGHIEALKCKRR
jgi:hypothetical protein